MQHISQVVAGKNGDAKTEHEGGMRRRLSENEKRRPRQRERMEQKCNDRTQCVVEKAKSLKLSSTYKV